MALVTSTRRNGTIGKSIAKSLPARSTVMLPLRVEKVTVLRAIVYHPNTTKALARVA